MRPLRLEILIGFCGREAEHRGQSSGQTETEKYLAGPLSGDWRQRGVKARAQSVDVNDHKHQN
jgi:hypothetical protein